MLGQLMSSSGLADLRWSEVSVDILKQMSPDVGEYLYRVPVKWSVADVSRYCTDRDDWGVFVSMWGCLWGAVTKAKAYRGVHRDAFIALVASDEFRHAAQDHIQRYGVVAHVLMLVKQFAPPDTWPSHGDSTGSGQASRSPLPRRGAKKAFAGSAGSRQCDRPIEY